MNFEVELKSKIKEKYGSVRAFANSIDTPYSTIDNIFKRGIMGVSIQVVLKICSALNIDVEKIKDDRLVEKTFYGCQLSENEQRLLEAYHNHPDMQPAINKMLDIASTEFSIFDDIAAEMEHDRKRADTNIK